jgi:gentisate 1,2-dioxygenase
MAQLSETRADAAALDAYYRSLLPYSLSPLWLAQENLLTDEPRVKALPFRWRWQELRPLALQAAELVGTEQAERRVLMLLNPGLEGRVATTTTLYAGIQIVMPGEFARAHRHTPAALRFVIEGNGAYTAVNGERLTMRPGDLVLTPSWTWHDHTNDTDAPIIWLDGLDIPLVLQLEQIFYEQHPDDRQPLTSPADVSVARYGTAGLLPQRPPDGRHSPLLNYSWERTWQALQALAASAEGKDEGSPFDGVLLDYTNPYTGGPVMPTMACRVQLLRPGERTRAHRHTESAIYHAVRGSGHTIVNDERLDWADKDVFCVPTWAWHEHVNASASEPAVLFSFTDTPVVQALGLYREQAHPQGHQAVG